MQRRPASGQQRLRQRAFLGAEADGFEPPAALPFEEGADGMALLADPIGADHAGARQGEDRLLIAGPEGGEPFDLAGEIRRRAGHRERAFHHQIRRPRQARGPGEAFIQEGMQRGLAMHQETEPGRHRMPAAGLQQPGLARRDHRRAEIMAGDGPAAALGEPLRHAGDAGGAVELLLDAAGDDADHPGVPALCRDQQHRMAGGGLRLRRGEGSPEHLGLHVLAPAVHIVQPLGHGPRLDRVIAQQQAEPEVRFIHPPPGVDPRAEHEAERMRRRHILHQPDIQQRRDPGMAAPGHDLEPLRHQRAIHPGQRHHIADRRQRHKIQQVDRRGFLPGAEMPGPAQHPVQRDDREERHRGGAEMPEAGGAVQPVWVHRGDDPRHRAFGFVVVQHHHIRLALGGGQRLMRGDPAIDADDQRRPARHQAADGGGVRPVALQQPVRDVVGDLAAQPAQRADHQRPGTGAIHIIVAEDGDGLTLPHSAGEAGGRAVHVEQHGGVRQQRAECRLQEIPDRFRPQPPRGKQPAQHLRQFGALGDGHAGARIPLPPHPAAAGDAARDRKSQRGHAVQPEKATGFRAKLWCPST